MSATLAVIECLCPDERVRQQRIDQRKSFNLPEHHQVDWERFQTVRALQPPAYPISCPLLHVNTLRPLDELVLECRDAVVLHAADKREVAIGGGKRVGKCTKDVLYNVAATSDETGFPRNEC